MPMLRAVIDDAVAWTVTEPRLPLLDDVLTSELK
jgi:hypothetical protein